LGDNRYAGETWIAGGKGFCCGDDEWADFYCGSQDSFRDVDDNEGSLHDDKEESPHDDKEGSLHDKEGSLHDDNEGSLHDSGEGLAIDNDGDALESRNDALVSNNAKSAVLEEKLEPQDEVNANANVWVTGI
jgi:hypothetical protein